MQREKVERTLIPGENHVYTITLQDGAAIMGEADQNGVDVIQSARRS